MPLRAPRRSQQLYIGLTSASPTACLLPRVWTRFTQKMTASARAFQRYVADVPKRVPVRKKNAFLCAKKKRVPVRTLFANPKVSQKGLLSREMETSTLHAAKGSQPSQPSTIPSNLPSNIPSNIPSSPRRCHRRCRTHDTLQFQVQWLVIAGPHVLCEGPWHKALARGFGTRLWHKALS